MGKVVYLFEDKGVCAQMPTIFDVAKAFLTIESMSHKKLQKLCYYAQAWHLAFMNERLFNNDFQAWVHGPVCVELYHDYKEYGFLDIPEEEYIPESIGNEEYEFISNVYNAYGEFSGDQLEELTHSELPWLEARGDLEDWMPSKEKIKDNSMRDYYKDIYERSN